MRLVIDTNIIISSLISNSIRRSILMDSGFELMAPEYTFTEIMNHANLIEKKSKLTSDDLQYVMDMLFSRILFTHMKNMLIAIHGLKRL